MHNDLFHHLANSILPSTASETHITLSRLHQQTRALYSGPFLLKLCRLNGIAMPVTDWNEDASLLAIFVGVHQHTTRLKEPCDLNGCIDSPFIEGDPRMRVVLDRAYLKGNLQMAIIFSSCNISQCVQVDTVRDIYHRFSSADYEGAKLRYHPPAACRFLTIPPVNDLVVKVLPRWDCRIRNPAGVTVWDAQAKINGEMWQKAVTGREVRELAEATFEYGYGYDDEQLTDEALERLNVHTVGDFIHHFMMDRYLRLDSAIYDSEAGCGVKPITVSRTGLVTIVAEWVGAGNDDLDCFM